MLELLMEYGPMVLSGLGLTVALSLAAVSLAILFGIMGASLRLSRNPVLRMIGRSYTTVIRGIPDLVLMLLVFFGGQMLLNNLGTATGWWSYLEISPFMAGSITIGFIFGAYMTETFRGAFLSIPTGQIEEAAAIGMSRSKLIRRIIIPSALRKALPAYSNEVIFMLHASVIASTITITDILGAGRTLNGMYYLAYEGLITAAVLYLIIVFIVDRIFNRAEKRFLAHLLR